MGRYFFTLRDGGAGYSAPDGVEFPDDEAALEYARILSAELMKNREQETRHWRIEVTQADIVIGGTSFITIDATLADLSSRVRKSMQTCAEHRLALSEAVAEAHALCRRSRALMARSRGALYVAVRNRDKP